MSSSVLSWQKNYSSRPPQMSVKTCLSPTEGFRVLFPPSQDSLNGTSQTTSPAHHLERGDKQSVWYAARREGISAKPPPTCASSVDSQCAPSRVLNCTTPKWTHSDICEHSILFSRHITPSPVQLSNLAPLAT